MRQKALFSVAKATEYKRFSDYRTLRFIAQSMMRDLGKHIYSVRFFLVLACPVKLLLLNHLFCFLVLAMVFLNWERLVKFL